MNDRTTYFPADENGSTANSIGIPAQECEPLFVTPCTALTPGYWKNHLAQLPGGSECAKSALPSGTGCSNNGPFTQQHLPQSLGGFQVTTILTAARVFAAMNCSNSGTPQQLSQNAIGCLAGHLLAAELNVANETGTCINATIAAANAFLVSIGYNGPTVSYSLTATQRATAIALKTTLDTFNNCRGCPQNGS